MKTLVRDLILSIGFYLVFLFAVDRGLGFYKETNNFFYFLTIGDIRDIFLYGGVAGTALVAGAVFLFSTLTDIEKTFRLPLRLKIIRRRLKKRLAQRTPAN